MDYRIEKRDAFQIVCKRKSVGKPQSAYATHDITAMWQEYGADGTMERVIACMPKNPVMKGLLGICFSSELNRSKLFSFNSILLSASCYFYSWIYKCITYINY